VYLPINKVVRKWNRKVKTVELPLISCYIFVKITKSQYLKVLETENVVSFVRFSKNLISIPEKEVEIMKRVTGEFNNLEVGATELNEGDHVEIIGGTLTGLKGLLTEKDNRKRFVVKLDNLGYSLYMEVEGKLLKKISPKRNHP
jgi:transcription antitermination factor NusG